MTNYTEPSTTDEDGTVSVNTFVLGALLNEDSVITHLISRSVNAESPEEVAAIMVEALTFAAGDVYRNGGTLDQFLTYAQSAWESMVPTMEAMERVFEDTDDDDVARAVIGSLSHEGDFDPFEDFDFSVFDEIYFGEDDQAA